MFTFPFILERRCHYWFNITSFDIAMSGDVSKGRCRGAEIPLQNIAQGKRHIIFSKINPNINEIATTNKLPSPPTPTLDQVFWVLSSRLLSIQHGSSPRIAVFPTSRRVSPHSDPKPQRLANLRLVRGSCWDAVWVVVGGIDMVTPFFEPQAIESDRQPINWKAMVQLERQEIESHWSAGKIVMECWSPAHAKEGGVR